MTQLSAPTTKRTVLIFVTCLALGGIIWFIGLGRAFNGLDSKADTVRHVLVWWCGGAFVVSALASGLQRASNLLWSTGFAIPMLGWGGVCAGSVTTNKIDVLWWTAFGFATVIAALLGAWIGRTIKIIP